MLRVQRAVHEDFGLTDAGALWRPARLPNGTRTALMACPKGHVFSLSKHTIHNDGAVTPSVVCPWEKDEWAKTDQSVRCPACGFHDHVVLDGWSPA